MNVRRIAREIRRDSLVYELVPNWDAMGEMIDYHRKYSQIECWISEQRNKQLKDSTMKFMNAKYTPSNRERKIHKLMTKITKFHRSNIFNSEKELPNPIYEITSDSTYLALGFKRKIIKTKGEELIRLPKFYCSWYRYKDWNLIKILARKIRIRNWKGGFVHLPLL